MHNESWKPQLKEGKLDNEHTGFQWKFIKIRLNKYLETTIYQLLGEI